jgi:proteasome accessory factor C
MAETAIERTKRALDLIPYILDRPGITVQELSRDFAVTEKQIRSDLDLLFVCGLPGYSPLELIEISTDDDYVDVLNPQLLEHPRNLTRREIVALVIALEALAASRNSNDPLRALISTLQAKLQAVLETPMSKPEVINAESDPYSILATVEQALASNRDLSIEYISAKSDARSFRRIAPSQLTIQNGSGYLRAWCFTAAGERTFRIDRIVAAHIEEGAAATFAHDSAQSEESAVAIVLTLRGAAREFLERHAGICTIQSITAEEAVVTVNIDDKNWLLRTLLGYGAAVTVEQPAQIAIELAELAREAHALYAS